MSHIYKEGNGVVDSIAFKAFSIFLPRYSGGMYHHSVIFLFFYYANIKLRFFPSSSLGAK